MKPDAKYYEKHPRCATCGGNYDQHDLKGGCWYIDGEEMKMCQQYVPTNKRSKVRQPRPGDYIEIKTILVDVQKNGIIRDKKTGYLIARLVEEVAFDSPYLSPTLPTLEAERDALLRERDALREALQDCARMLHGTGGGTNGPIYKRVAQALSTLKGGS